jgi:hypothetical protein
LILPQPTLTLISPQSRSDVSTREPVEDGMKPNNASWFDAGGYSVSVRHYRLLDRA